MDCKLWSFGITMDTIRLCKLIGVEPDGSLVVTAISPMKWGEKLILNCQHEALAPGGKTAFEIILTDCRDVHWRVYAHLKHPEDITLPVATVVNIRLGTGQHRKPFQMLTDFFGLTISYGELVVQQSL
jgi:hypothetical protein